MSNLRGKGNICNREGNLVAGLLDGLFAVGFQGLFGGEGPVVDDLEVEEMRGEVLVTERVDGPLDPLGVARVGHELDGDERA